jgi:hypothetical protein
MASLVLLLAQNERTKIVKTFVKYAVAGLCFAALFLLVVSAPSRAQVLAHSGDVAGYAGYVYVSDPNQQISFSDNHVLYGANGGYNVTPYVTVLGEWGYVPLASFSDVSVKTQLFGGGARFNLTPGKKIVPYGVFNVGGDRLALSESGFSGSANGYYFGFGGGASCYVGKNWGVRPEFRYVRLEYNSLGFNSFAMTGGIFYQWGGTGKKIK